MSEDIRDDLEFVPLYRMANHVEAVFLKEVFDTENILSLFQNLQVAQFPLEVGNQAEVLVMVNKDDFLRAKRLVLEAREGAISNEGAFVELEE